MRGICSREEERKKECFVVILEEVKSMGFYW
jgi:hypothetical protein